MPSLLRALVAGYGHTYAALGLLKLAGDALNFAGPMCVVTGGHYLYLHGICTMPWITYLSHVIKLFCSLLNGLLRYLGSSPAQHASSGPRHIIDVHSRSFGATCAALLVASLILKVSSLPLCMSWLICSS